MSRWRSETVRPAREIAEEAFHLLRAAPVQAWGYYCLGTVPFVGALIYFVNAMEVYAYAERQLPLMSLGLTFLFVWMKTFQARFAVLLGAALRGEAPPAWGPRSLLRTAYTQTILQTTGVFMLPVAFACAAPFVAVYSFYQNLSALDNGTGDLRGLARAAMEEAKRWQMQAHVLVWMTSPVFLIAVGSMAWLVPSLAHALGELPQIFAGVVTVVLLTLLIPLSPLAAVIAINLSAAAFFMSVLLKSYLDVDTMLSWAPGAAVNGAFLTGVIGCTYLVMDPLVKAAFVLRCYYGASRRSGEDLRAALRRAATSGAVMLAITAGALIAGGAHAETTTASQQLDSAIEKELEEAVYTWRMPREEADPSAQEKGLVARGMEDFSEWLKGRILWVRDVIRDIFDRLGRGEGEGPGAGGGEAGGPVVVIMKTMLVLMLIALAGAVVYFGVRQLRAFRQEAAAIEQAVAPAPTVELEDESARPDALPEDGWLRMANELYARGEIRLAMRALFLAMLSSLAARGLVSIVRYKSNLEYQRELKRRTQAAPNAFAAFRDGVLLYERVWYGEYPANADGYQALLSAHEKVRRA